MKGKVGKDYQRNEWKEKKKRKDGKGRKRKKANEKKKGKTGKEWMGMI